VSIVETIYPDGNIASGSWSGSYTDIDESGTHDGDTTYRSLSRSTTGITTSEFEVSLQNPAATSWRGTPSVRDAESWKTPLDLQVRDAENWTVIQALSVRDGEAWKLLVPQIVVRVVAREIELGPTPSQVTGTMILKSGATTIQSKSLTLSGTYGETVMTVAASTLIQAGVANGNDLRVAVSGRIQNDDPSDNGELRVTQITVELND